MAHAPSPHYEEGKHSPQTKKSNALEEDYNPIAERVLAERSQKTQSFQWRWWKLISESGTRARTKSMAALDQPPSMLYAIFAMRILVCPTLEICVEFSTESPDPTQARFEEDASKDVQVIARNSDAVILLQSARLSTLPTCCARAGRSRVGASDCTPCK
jgi:hypothetical protein